MKLRPLLVYGALALAALALDQWVKHLVVTGLELNRRVELLPFLSLYRTINTGISFSLLEGLGRAGLLAVALVVSVFILWLAFKTRPEQVLARLGFALVLGGAAGNLVDRALRGHVVDYILFHTPNWSFAIFNLADSFITVGAVLVVLQELVDWRSAAHGEEPPR